MILGDRVGHLLEEDRLAGPGRRDDQTALSFADRRDDVDHPHAEIAARGLQMDALIGVAGTQIVEDRPRCADDRWISVDGIDAQQGEIALPILGWTDLPDDRVARPQIEAFDLRRRDVDVVGAGEITPVLAPQEPVPLVQNLQDPLGVQVDGGTEQVPLDPEDEILLAQARYVVDMEVFGDCLELRDGLPLEIDDVHDEIR